MKSRRLIALSVLFNVALLAAVGWVATQRPAPLPPQVITEVVTNVVVEPAPAPAPAPAVVEKLVAPAAFDWRQVESPDYREYIARLRKVGCPEQTIRDIIIADVCKLYAEKRAALARLPQVVHYWQSSEMQYTRDNVKYQQQVSALEKEKAELIRDLLGVDLKREIARVYSGEERQDRSLMFLPPERRGPLQDLLDSYREKERAIFAEADGHELTEDQQNRIKALHDERDKALASQLTASELKEYEMTNSRLVRNIRSNLNGFEASEEEFLAIYNAKKAFEDAFGSEKQDRKNETPEQKAARKQAEQQMDAAMRDALGESRYAEYQRSQNNSWEDLYRITKRYDLPKEAAVAVYVVKQAAEAEYKNIQANTSLPPDQRLAALQQLSLQAQQATVGALGDDASKYYFRKNGQWIKRIGQLPQPKKSG